MYTILSSPVVHHTVIYCVHHTVMYSILSSTAVHTVISLLYYCHQLYTILSSIAVHHTVIYCCTPILSSPVVHHTVIYCCTPYCHLLLYNHTVVSCCTAYCHLLLYTILSSTAVQPYWSPVVQSSTAHILSSTAVHQPSWEGYFVNEAGPNSKFRFIIMMTLLVFSVKIYFFRVRGPVDLGATLRPV